MIPRISLLPLLLLGLLTIGCGQAPAAPGAVKLPAKDPGKYQESIDTGGEHRTYILHVPKAYDATKPLPLVVLLHGLSGSAAAVEFNTGMADVADKEGFVLVTPNALGNVPGWNAEFFNFNALKVNDVEFLDKLIDKVETEVGVDTDRVFIAGHSNGAFMAHLLGAKLSKKIAAFAAVAGTIGVPDADGGAKMIPLPSAPVSALLIHGKQDEMVQYDSKAQALLHGIGAMESAKWWAKQDGCSATPEEIKSSDGNVVTDKFTGGKSGTEVELVSITNGMHAWPGGFVRGGTESKTGVKATDLIWQFFKDHPKKRL